MVRTYPEGDAKKMNLHLELKRELQGLAKEMGTTSSRIVDILVSLAPTFFKSRTLGADGRSLEAILKKLYANNGDEVILPTNANGDRHWKFIDGMLHWSKNGETWRLFKPGISPPSIRAKKPDPE